MGSSDYIFVRKIGSYGRVSDRTTPLDDSHSYEGEEKFKMRTQREERGSDNPLAGSGNWTWLRGVTAVSH